MSFLDILRGLSLMCVHVLFCDTIGPDQARLVSKISVSMGVIIGGINMLVLAINKDWIGKIFTKEDDVLALVRSVVRTTVLLFFELVLNAY